jgi:hypothetical protein
MEKISGYSTHILRDTHVVLQELLANDEIDVGGHAAAIVDLR